MLSTEELMMKSHLFLRGSLATLFALGFLGVARTAGADPTSCTLDSDCTKGFTCQVVGATACAGIACAVPPAGGRRRGLSTASGV
jgi:hypothetical protein